MKPTSSPAERPHLVLVTTVPDTLLTILAGQPAFLRQHFTVSVVTSGTQRVAEIEANEGTPTHCVQMGRRISILRDLRSLLSMYRMLRRLQPDIVHSYTPKAGLISMVAGWLAGVPVRIHTFTGLLFPTATGLKRWLLTTTDRMVCLCATCIVPEGEGVRRDLIEHSITNKPLSVIGNGNIAGIDTCYFSRVAPGVKEQATALRDQLSIDASAFTFCYVGRINRDKGIRELADAFSLLDPLARLIIVGDLDQTAPVAKETMDALERNPRVRLVGFQSDIRPYLAISDILCLPSYREGFPNVLLQAGAMSLPVITTNVNGCNEIISDGVNGWIVEPKNVDQLWLAMARAMKRRADLESIGSKARTLIVSKFERSHYLTHLLDFYFRLWNNTRQ